MTQKPDDVLHAAARALREETLRESSAARFTRLRVMASLRESEVRRRTQTVLLLPFAACLAVASAWGMAVGGITEMRTAVVDALGLQSPPSEPPAPSKKSKSKAPTPAPADPAPPLPAPALAPAPAPTLTTPAPAPSPPSTALLPPRVEKRSVASAPSAPRALSNAPPPRAPAPNLSSREAVAAPPLSNSDRAHELYRAAHRAHFTDHDCDRALTGWDAYLAASPRGPLALEARYNRALCLVRLGRAAEARRALRPFATAPGGYRQKEATALLAVIAEN